VSTGTVLTENYITVNPGTEASQQHCVILMTDAKKPPHEHTISKFTKPLTTLELGTAPFNPFIIANKERKKKFIYLIQNLQL
jgi:hypothetical protein